MRHHLGVLLMVSEKPGNTPDGPPGTQPPWHEGGMLGGGWLTYVRRRVQDWVHQRVLGTTRATLLWGIGEDKLRRLPLSFVLHCQQSEIVGLRHRVEALEEELQSLRQGNDEAGGAGGEDG